MEAGTAGAEAFAVDQEITLTRVFDAPRELVFEAWTEAKHFARWFGPPGVTVPFCTLEARPGGTLHFCHRVTGGPDLWLKGVFLEVVAPARLVFDLRFVDASGNPAAPSLLPEWPLDGVIRTTVTFEGQARTKLTVHQRATSQKPSAREAIGRERKMAREGWGGTLDNLAEHLAGEMARRKEGDVTGSA